MASINHNLPTEVKADQDANHGLNREGMSITKGASGRTLSRVWSDVANRTYRIDPIMLALAEDGLKNLKAFDHNTVMGTLGFWLKEQVDGDHFNVPCGGLGDASRTCFPVPFYGAISDGVYMIDGVPQLSGVTIHEAANTIQTDAAAAPVDGSLMSASNSAAAAMANFGGLKPDSMKWTPDGLGSAAYIFLTSGSMAANGGLASPTLDYTAICYIYEPLASPRTIGVGLRWYDSTPSYLTMSLTDRVLVQGWNVIVDTKTAPASTAYATPILRDSVNTDTTPLYMGGWAVAPDAYDRLHLPSFAPNVAEFASAPALNERITASGSGRGMAFCKFHQPSMAWSMVSPGHATPNTLSAIEEVEI